MSLDLCPNLKEAFKDSEDDDEEMLLLHKLSQTQLCVKESEIYFHFSLNNFTVVAQSYKVDIEILAASRGCTAILRCVVPSFVKELVRVVSWVQEPAFFIYPSLQGGEFKKVLQ